MNIKQALKQKNRLAARLKQTLDAMKSNNSVVSGAKPAYNSMERLEEANGIMMELVDIKTRIHKANAPVVDLIFEAGELKSMISALRSMSCAEGPTVSFRSDAPVEYSATIDEVKRDELVADLEARLDEINDQLDEFNATTQIGA